MKVELGLDDVKLKEALVAEVVAAGPLVMEVVGGVASTVKVLVVL
jgi:hypothetical protein